MSSVMITMRLGFSAAKSESRRMNSARQAFTGKGSVPEGAVPRLFLIFVLESFFSSPVFGDLNFIISFV